MFVGQDSGLGLVVRRESSGVVESYVGVGVVLVVVSVY